MIFIPGNVPSSKNSKIKTKRGVFHSSSTVKYLKSFGIKTYSVRKKEVICLKKVGNLFKPYADEFKKEFLNEEYPYIVGIHFVRNSKRKFDFHNIVQIVADLLVAHSAIEDDNMDYFIPVAFKIKESYYSVDKENPGVFIINLNK